MVKTSFLRKIVVEEYDIGRFDFRAPFLAHTRETLGCNDLARLHEHVPEEFRPKGLIGSDNDQGTYLHGLLYRVDPGYYRKPVPAGPPRDRGFIQTYRRFVNHVAQTVFHETLVYQALPTIRVHLPDNWSVYEFHRDRDYNHPAEEINLWVPLTPARETASLYIESAYEKKDYKPLNVDYGEVAIFDSGLLHGNQLNREGYTRVSFDFRVIPLSDWKPSERSSMTQNIQFTVGAYYAVTDPVVNDAARL